jgi:hypothetical protein
MRYTVTECVWLNGAALAGWSGSGAENIFKVDLKPV